MANGYVRYGNSIHLDGFQILDFCIENAISLESLSDRNLGRKVFLTGNDTNEGYLRENVWDGTRWRATAYLDDIAKVNEKLDLIFGDELDTDTIIDSWKEVQDFLSGIEDTKTLMTMLDGKLDKTGGTISNGEWAKQLILNNNNSAAVGLRFHMNDEMMGILYMSSSHKLFFYDGTTPNLEVLHSGNVGEYTVGAAKKLAPFYGSIMRPTSADVEPLNDGSVYAFMATSTMTVGKPAYDGFILNFEWDNSGLISQLFLGNGSVSANDPDKRMQARFNTSNGWSDWKTIAFTDSTVEAAKKLTTDSHVYASFSDTNKYLLFGATAAEQGYKTYVDGYNIHFRYGGGYVSAMTITEEGRVLINRTSAILDRQLSIGNGGVYVSATLGESPALGSVGSNSLLVGSSTYGIQHWVLGNGQGNIQAGRFDGTATAYALNLNPLGGAVNVGEGGLNVYGQVVIGTTNRANLYFSRNSVNYIWAPSKGGYFAIGVNDVGETSPASASLVIGPTSVIPGERNNAVSLGTSSYRWSNVYSVGGNFSGNVRIANDYGLLSTTTSGSVVQMIGIGKNNALFVGTDACIVNKMPIGVYGSLINFYTGDTIETRTKTMTLTSSGHVLIGGAEDDADYALIAKGNWKLTSTDKGDYFSIKLRDVNVDYYGYDAADSWCNHNFISNGTTRFFVAGRDTEWSYIKGKFRAYGELRAEELATFAAGAYIPSGQKLTIGSVTFEEDAAGRVKVDGDMYTTGTLASGGKAKEGTGTGSGSANVRDFELPANGQTTYDCEHMLNTKNVIVQVFEKAIQNNIEVWEMILTDVTIVTEDRVTVTFGRPTTKVHKVHIIGGNVS